MIRAQMLLVSAVLALSAAAACQAHADDGAPEALRFRHLEFAQARDPLLSSSPVFGQVHHTPSDQLAPAAAAIRARIIGMPRVEAEATLVRAGAHCSTPNPGAVESCSYHDLETVDEFSDDIVWTVNLAIADQRVADMTVDRTWNRH